MEPKDSNPIDEPVSALVRFVASTSGFRLLQSSDSLELIQNVDGKALKLSCRDLSDVIPRTDTEGRDFIQVNFQDGRKILITDQLIGFKPLGPAQLTEQKLPRVVTTPDINSVLQAIVESLNANETNPDDVDVLRRVFMAVIDGGESIGFDLRQEKFWLQSLLATHQIASA